MFDKPENRLLAALEPVDLSLLTPHLRTGYFAKDAILQEQDTLVDEVYFPLNGMVALVSVMENGQIVESALVGREGAIGAFAGLGPWHAFTRAAVIATSHVQAAVAKDPLP